MNKKITMIVLNAVTHDARVLKEANSLVSNGYEVSIIGASNTSHDQRINGALVTYITLNASKLAHLAKRISLKFSAFSLFFLILSVVFTWLLISEEYFFNIISYINIISYVKLKRCFYWIGFSISFFLFVNKIFNIQSRLSAFCGSILRLYVELYRILSARKKVLRKIKSLNPDIIHAHDLNALIIAKYCKDRHKSILVYDSHEIFAQTSQRRWLAKRIFTAYEGYLAKSVDYFITINDSIASYLSSQYKSLPQPIVIRNACILPAQNIKNSNLIREITGIKPSVKIILYQGGFALSRGLPQLITMAKFLNDDWALVLMGEGRLQKILERRAKDKLGQKVFFIPKVPHADLNQWTSSATIGIIPYENTCLNHLYCTPNKLWEYPSANIPFFATKMVEMKKAIEKGIGWLIEDIDNPRWLAHQINSLTEEEIKSAKAKCQEFIKENNWQQEEEKLINLYKNIPCFATP